MNIFLQIVYLVSYFSCVQLFLRYCRAWNMSAAILENISGCNVELYNLQEDPGERNNLVIY